MTQRSNDSLARKASEVESYAGESGLVGSTETDTGSRRDPAERRISALDGIRAVAILLVIVHNAGTVRGDLSGVLLRLWTIVSNAGWIGVQMFFALSGFLITRILLDSKGAPGALRSFYARRLLRIAPLYYATLIILFGIAPHIPAIARLGETHAYGPIWYWLYLSNWISPWAGATGLPHVWSLAVEEQFYLFWPLLIAALSERATAYVCVAMVVVAVAVRAVLHMILPPNIAEEAAYTFTITRWDAIALGAIVAIAMRARRVPLSPRTIGALLVACMVALLGVLAVEHGISSKGVVADWVTMPVTGIASALLVMACVLPSNDGNGANGIAWMPRLLSARPLAWIGKYSYAIYVFHMPVHLALSPYLDPTLAVGSGSVRFVKLALYVFVIFAISAALAVISWNVLEQPMLSLKRYFPMPRPVARRAPVARA